MRPNVKAKLAPYLTAGAIALPLLLGLAGVYLQAVQMGEIARQLAAADLGGGAELRAQLLSQALAARQRLFLVAGFSVLVSLAAAVFVGRRFYQGAQRSIAVLAARLEAIVRGEYSGHPVDDQWFSPVQPQGPLEEALEKLADLYTGLTEKIYQRTEELNHRTKQAETLYQGGRALSSSLTLNEILDLILAHLGRMIPNDRAALLLRQGDGLVIAASRGFPESARPSDISVSIKSGDVFDEICRTRQPLSIADITQRRDWQNVSGLKPARCWVGFPLISSGEVIGMLSLVRETSVAFSQDEITQAATFAGQAAYGIQNARLLEQVTHFNQELEDQVNRRTEELASALAQLERLDRTKSNFIHIASHELRTPLTVISGYNQILMSHPVILKDEQLHKVTAGIQTGSTRLHEIVNSMLELAKIESQVLQLNPMPLSLANVLRELLPRFAHVLEDRQLSLTVNDLSVLPVIEADTEGIQKVFNNLIGNAIKYTPDGGSIVISGRNVPPERDFPDGAVRIEISDSGIGIDPSSIELIFTRFYQTGEVALHSSSSTKFKGGGPGLGLTVARGIVEMHRGKLWGESPGYDEQKCPGSNFYILLPQRQRPATRELLKKTGRLSDDYAS
ncbi:MAG: GAF domain-containing protein [Anaerolineaceae bacterium]|nr:GAF domain-containing protein [Anaerolineaceae bacterium]